MFDYDESMDAAPLLTAAKALFAAVGEPGAGEALGLDGWLDVLSDTQEVLNVLAAVQAVAMAQVAAFDSEDQHGFGPRGHRGLGHASLDAPDLVAARLGCSSQSATSRVEVAIAQVTTMPGLVTAMAQGRLDQFRSAVVAEELHDVPADAREALVGTLDRTGRLTGETAGPLRRRVRRLLPPEVLAARAAGERERRGLHRSTASLGVDHWAAWLPVETSRPAWAAVTTLAQDYLRAGRAETLAQARADALGDLVLGRATTTVVLHPTVPLEELGADADARPGDELVAVSGLGAAGEAYVRRQFLRDLTRVPGRRRARAARPAEALALDARTGGVVGVLVGAEGAAPARLTVPETDRYRPSPEVERVVKARDGRCRFPGCQVPVRFVDLDHVTAYDHGRPDTGGPTSTANLACLCRRHHRVKQRTGWRVALAPDGTMTWTDPSGRSRTSWPEDHRPPPRPHRPGSSAGTEREHATDADENPSEPVPWEAAWREAELEPYSLLEDRFLDVLLEAGVPAPFERWPHRDRTPLRRGRGGVKVLA